MIKKRKMNALNKSSNAADEIKEVQFNLSKDPSIVRIEDDSNYLMESPSRVSIDKFSNRSPPVQPYFTQPKIKDSLESLTLKLNPSESRNL